jgi:hypothetical protein
VRSGNTIPSAAVLFFGLAGVATMSTIQIELPDRLAQEAQIPDCFESLRQSTARGFFQLVELFDKLFAAALGRDMTQASHNPGSVAGEPPAG